MGCAHSQALKRAPALELVNTSPSGKEVGARVAEGPDSILNAEPKQQDSAGMAAKATENQMARLILPNGMEHLMKVHRGTLGEDVTFVDIGDLYAKANVLTFDPGFSCTASCASAITYIDGEAGRCLYRGYPVAELCKHCDYMEVAHLLLKGELPTRSEKVAFVNRIKDNAMVHDNFRVFFQSFSMNAHPMAIMVAATGALASFSQQQIDWAQEENRMSCAVDVVSKMPTLAAMAYRAHVGEPFVYPQARLGYAENFLHMMFGRPSQEYTANPIHVRALDRFLTIHADHEQNASTSTVRIAGSSQANPLVCIASGIACLWGPAHGGANEAVLKMLQQIGSKENIPQFISDVKAKREGIRLMGFGHRVYKNYDPRAGIMRDLCHEILADLQVSSPKLELAMELERIALSDEYFKKRNLYPNVDFYSGIVLQAIGIPVQMFTVMFALGRCLGWITHWLEMVGGGQMRIGRPRQLYTGEREKPVMPLQERGRSTDRAGIARSASRAFWRC